MGYNTPAYKNRHITVYKFLQHTHFKVPPPTLYFNYNTHTCTFWDGHPAGTYGRAALACESLWWHLAHWDALPFLDSCKLIAHS